MPSLITKGLGSSSSARLNVSVALNGLGTWRVSFALFPLLTIPLQNSANYVFSPLEAQPAVSIFLLTPGPAPFGYVEWIDFDMLGVTSGVYGLQIADFTLVTPTGEINPSHQIVFNSPLPPPEAARVPTLNNAWDASG